MDGTVTQATLELNEASEPNDSVDTTSFLAKLGATTYDAWITILLCWFAIAFVPSFLAPTWTPRMLGLLAVLPLGALSLAHALRQRDRATIAGVAFICWAVVSALLTPRPALLLLGPVGRESSVLILAASLGLWASARSLTDGGRRLLEKALIGAFALSASVGLLQVVLTIELGTLSMLFGRATGLNSHPVYFGATMGAGVALALARPRFRWTSAGLVLLFATAIGVSGARIALLVGLVVVVIQGRRFARTELAAAIGTYLIGSVLAVVLTRQFAAVSTLSDGTGAVDRLGATDGAFGVRGDVWMFGLEAFWHRPIAGHGIGNFRTATHPYYTPEFAGTHALDDRVAWFDAHNIVIELLVAVGIPGLALALVFAWLACRAASGPLRVAAAAIAATWLFQPAGLAALPLALGMLGAASGELRLSVARSRWVPYLTAVGALLAASLAVGDLRLRWAADDFDARAFESGAAWFPHDSVVADLAAQIWQEASPDDPVAEERTLEWSRRAIDREPNRAGFWENYSKRQFYFFDDDGARRSLERSLELQPWRPSAWVNMVKLAESTDDAQLEMRAQRAICEMGMDLCDLDR